MDNSTQRHTNQEVQRYFDESLNRSSKRVDGSDASHHLSGDYSPRHAHNAVPGYCFWTCNARVSLEIVKTSLGTSAQSKRCRESPRFKMLLRSFTFVLPLPLFRKKQKLDYQHNFEECPLKKNKKKQHRQAGSLDIPSKKACQC